MLWPFEKYTGCGNDFILFDNRSKRFPFDQPSIIQSLCHRRAGIGADGILLWEDSETADACMRIFNSDGSEAEMCGNGLRCFVKWLEKERGKTSSCSIEVSGKILYASYTENGITIELGPPAASEWNIPFPGGSTQLILHHIDTGVPHAVIFVEDIHSVNVEEIGSSIRNAWPPNGTNVTFAEMLMPQKIKVRTYERGVEGETAACGTGAAAAAAAAARIHQSSSPVLIETRSGESLAVDFIFENDHFSRLALTGPAKAVFRGAVDIFDCV